MDKADKGLTRFRALRGEDALNAQQSIQDEIDRAFKEGRESLVTPAQQLEYDSTTRNFRLRYIDSVFASHANEQAKIYAANTNNKTADLHLNLIAQNPTDNQIFKDNAAELVRARVRQTQVEGLGADAATEAANSAVAEAHSARARAMAANGDAQGALEYARRNQKGLSVVDSRNGATFYDALVTSLQTKADAQTGTAVGREEYAKSVLAHPYASGAMPIYREATQSLPTGMSERGLVRTVQLESGGDPNARNGDAVGVGQFMPGTWRQYGMGGSPTDPDASIMAIQRYASANRVGLTRALGHQPSDAELYLAHQQGLGGATKLFSNPNARAGSLVGDDAIRKNGGDPNAPAYMFTSMWVNRFNNPDDFQPASVPTAPDASPRSRKAAAVSGLIGRMNDLSPGAYAHAMQTINQLSVQDQITSGQDERARKQASDRAADSYVSQLWQAQQSGMAQPTQWKELANKIAADNNLEWTVKDALMGKVLEVSGQKALLGYGPGYEAARTALFSAPDAPGHISDVTSLLNRDDITIVGLEDLYKRWKLAADNPRYRDGQKALGDTMAEVQRRMAKEQIIPGMAPITNLKGLEKFGEFQRRYLQMFDEWTSDPKHSPYDFLNDAKKREDLMNQIYPPTQRKMDELMSLKTGAEVPSEEQLPPVPTGVSTDVWREVMASPPLAPNGQPMSLNNWAEVLQKLRENPTEKTFGYFRKHWPDFDPKALVDKLGRAPAPAAPPSNKPWYQRALPSTMLPPELRDDAGGKSAPGNEPITDTAPAIEPITGVVPVNNSGAEPPSNKAWYQRALPPTMLPPDLR
jgi:hypothetical protein